MQKTLAFNHYVTNRLCNPFRISLLRDITKFSLKESESVQKRKTKVIIRARLPNPRPTILCYLVDKVQSRNGLICIWNPWQNRVVVTETEQMRIAWNTVYTSPTDMQTQLTYLLKTFPIKKVNDIGMAHSPNYIMQGNLKKNMSLT